RHLLPPGSTERPAHTGPSSPYDYGAPAAGSQWEEAERKGKIREQLTDQPSGVRSRESENDKTSTPHKFYLTPDSISVPFLNEIPIPAGNDAYQITIAVGNALTSQSRFRGDTARCFDHIQFIVGRFAARFQPFDHYYMTR